MGIRHEAKHVDVSFPSRHLPILLVWMSHDSELSRNIGVFQSRERLNSGERDSLEINGGNRKTMRLIHVYVDSAFGKIRKKWVGKFKKLGGKICKGFSCFEIHLVCSYTKTFKVLLFCFLRFFWFYCT